MALETKRAEHEAAMWALKLDEERFKKQSEIALQQKRAKIAEQTLESAAHVEQQRVAFASLRELGFAPSEIVELRRVEGLGGEGVMLRRPGSRYVAGRSDTLLKVKSFLDTEARVIGHQAGTGKHQGRVGALQVELPNGTRFKVGTGMSDAERESPPALGEIITVRYQELTDGGVPRFPSYIGVRTDIDWDALVAALG